MSQNKYHTLAKEIAKALQIIHSDYKQNGIILSLKTYDEKGLLSYAYLRKLIDMELLVNIGTSKKTSRYKWEADEDPDYYELALSVIDFSPTRRPVIVQENKQNSSQLDKVKIDSIIRLAIRLHEKGYSTEEIQEEVPKLLEIASI